MTRRRSGLAAVLSEDRQRVLCGRCRADIGWVGAEASSRRARLLVVPVGLQPDDRGVWRMTRRALVVRHGRRPTRRPPFNSHQERPPDGWAPYRLPIRAACPGCGAEQELSAATLDVDPQAFDAGKTFGFGAWHKAGDKPDPAAPGSVRGLRMG